MMMMMVIILITQMGEDSLGSPVREGTRTPTHAKRKASRKVRLPTSS